MTLRDLMEQIEIQDGVIVNTFEVLIIDSATGDQR